MLEYATVSKVTETSAYLSIQYKNKHDTSSDVNS